MPRAGKLLLVGIAAAVLCAIVYPPVGVALVILGAIAMLVRATCLIVALPSLIGKAIGRRRKVQHLRQRSASRAGESICQFARSFDVRRTDTWVLRAVYVALQDDLRWVNPAFPVHADDAICDDLLIDPEDLGDDIVWSIAARARRRLDHFERNPFYPSIVTVRDLVCFFMHQPRIEAED